MNPRNEEDRVISLSEAAVQLSVSTATLRRMIAAGEAPTVTWMSPRRCGIRIRHLREYLDQRAGKPVDPSRFPHLSENKPQAA